jgi:Domain of unknown function (DUF4365)
MYSPLSNNDIESELSYAYLHAVASSVGINCRVENRHGDNRCVDVVLTCYEKFEGSYREEFDLKIQLKATVATPTETESYFSYFFKGIKQYDFLREETKNQHRILVVLFLPEERKEWLKVSPDQLILKNCAYWLSLRGADACANSSGTTVYLPSEQALSPQNLLTIFERLSKNEPLNYVSP